MKIIPLVWDLIRQFKRHCKSMGWWVSPYEDVIYADGEYHNFICAKKVHPKTFRAIAFNQRYPVRESDRLYRLVNISYMAWIFQEKPSGDIFAILAEDQDIRRHTAIYDLSDAYSERAICIKVNETKSIVFQEFERFLRDEYCLNLINRLPLLQM